MFWISLILIISVVAQGQGEYGSVCQTPEQVSGICIPALSCKPVFELFQNAKQRGGPVSDSDRLKLQELHCGTFRNMHHVCCEKSNVQLNGEGLSVLQNEDCGNYLTTKLTYSNETQLSGYPWMALLIYDDERDPYRCGGSLITDQYVLTAAHCIRRVAPPVLLRVRLGEHRKSTDPDCVQLNHMNICAPSYVELGIAETIIHPNYRSDYNDIALIRLERKVELQKHIKTICLPIYDDLREMIHDNYVVSGWGRTETGKSSDVLRAAVMPRVNLRSCEDQLRPFGFTNKLNEGHLCAGGKDLIDSCKGDSGGPMGFRDMYDGRPRFVQYGIVASGLKYCGVENVPGIYTSVSHNIQWITDHIKRN